MTLITAAVGMLLSYANGANDNVKGVATLLGSGTLRYRAAIVWATITTALGSLSALYLGQELLRAFTGQGLVPDTVAAEPSFAAAVGLGAGLTVLLATRVGFPISTTHALIGALLGAAFVGSADGVDIYELGNGFLFPLLTSPFIAIALTSAGYPPLNRLRRKLGITQTTCICVANEVVARVPGRIGHAEALQAVELPHVAVDDEVHCRLRYDGGMKGVSAARVADAVHFLSAGAVSFARGLNDTPKIAALLLAGSAFSPTAAVVLAGAAIAAGALLGARRVAHTMAHRITEMTPGQGLVANIVTAAIVIGAAKLGMPVSTTHVSCGALFGIGAATRQAHWNTIARIVLAWVTTLPLAAALGAAASFLLP